MTPEEFRKRWDSNDDGGGITNQDVAECAIRWGICDKPFIHTIDEIIYLVTNYANTKDKELWKNRYKNVRRTNND